MQGEQEILLVWPHEKEIRLYMYSVAKVSLSIPCVWFECTNGDNQEEVEGHAIDKTILPFFLLSLLTRKEGLHGSRGN